MDDPWKRDEWRSDVKRTLQEILATLREVRDALEEYARDLRDITEEGK